MLFSVKESQQLTIFIRRYEIKSLYLICGPRQFNVNGIE